MGVKISQLANLSEVTSSDRLIINQGNQTYQVAFSTLLSDYATTEMLSDYVTIAELSAYIPSESSDSGSSDDFLTADDLTSYLNENSYITEGRLISYITSNSYITEEYLTSYISSSVIDLEDVADYLTSESYIKGSTLDNYVYLSEGAEYDAQFDTAFQAEMEEYLTNNAYSIYEAISSYFSTNNE